LWQFAGTVILGVPLWVVPLYLSLSGLNALFEHANVTMSERLDQWLRFIIVTPHMHKVHHSRLAAETDSNYSNIFSLWDRIFGTYTARVDYRNLRYGLDGFDGEKDQTFARLLTGPFF